MSIFPNLKRCPCCNSFNLIKVNGITYENKFKSLAAWALKKEFRCKKCKQELGLFINMRNNDEKIIWINYLKCEDCFYKKLNELQLVKNKAKIKSKKFLSASKEICEIQLPHSESVAIAIGMCNSAHPNITVLKQEFMY